MLIFNVLHYAPVFFFIVKKGACYGVCSYIFLGQFSGSGFSLFVTQSKLVTHRALSWFVILLMFYVGYFIVSVTPGLIF